MMINSKTIQASDYNNIVIINNKIRGFEENIKIKTGVKLSDMGRIIVKY